MHNPDRIQAGAELPTTGGKIFQYLFRGLSWNGILSLFGAKDLQGAALSASRAQEFNELLARAPHLAGFLKMLLIGAFPWLLFAIVAGNFRILVMWTATYFSVLLWTPIWTLLYHVMVGITLSADMMAAFGRLGDGISLYSAQLVTSRIYHMYEVYSYLQILTGTLFTAAIIVYLKPHLTDSEQDKAPGFIDEAKGTVGTGAKAVGAML